jgi:putative tricarboxylic transport membrane protein
VFENIIQGIITAVDPLNLLMLVLGVVAGIIFGALPGLTGPMAIALFIPLTYSMGVTPALIFLSAIYSGSIFGGSITAILLKIPGDSGSAATVFDGYVMAQRGEAGRALGLSAATSAIGGLFSGIILLFAAPNLARVALTFSSGEYFALAFMGLCAITSLGGKNQLKSLVSCVIGLVLACIGTDQISGNSRMLFGMSFLYDGIQFVPAMIGFFAFSELFGQIYAGIKMGEVIDKNVSTKLPSIKELWRHKFLILKSAILGTWIGILPGTGATLASFMGYSEAVRSSKHPEKFGTGCAEGIIGPETANNAACGGSFVPTLALGIPGSGAATLLISAFMLHGIRPGPMIFKTQPKMVFAIIISFILSNLIFLLLGVFGTRYFGKILETPYRILFPIIVALTIVGSFSLRNNMGDVAIMLVLGGIGFLLLNRANFPIAPLILGFVLGPIMEFNFRRAYLLSGSSYVGIFTRPITAVIMAISLFFLVYPFIRNFVKKRRANDVPDSGS